ncbi:MAG: putative long-chain-fatty-acid--CoA ligase [Thermoleophilia bacterium]|nr:putative long-chain-fatty-acid--CoA ligase [Thermoleophilia bacterium]
MTETLHGMFVESARTNAAKTAYVERVDGEWRNTSFADALARVEAIGAGLLELGVQPDDRVVILSMSNLAWSLTDYAILGTAATTVPIYQTSSPDECRYIIDNAKGSVIFVEDRHHLAKIRDQRDQLPELRTVIVFDPTGVELDAGAGELSLAELEERGRAAGSEAWHAAGATVTPQDLATIIYTSGTTGPPKGCMLTHENYVFMTEQAANRGVGLFEDDDRIVLFLPLAHTFARVTHFAATRVGIELAFTTIATLMDDLAELQPTLLPSVPRVFEKAYTRILGQFNEATGAKRKLIDRAMRVGTLRGKYVQRGRRVPPVLAAQYALFHKLVFAKIHARFGGKMRLFISGGAPLSREVGEFFLACGIIIVEGYGLTESTTAIAVNHPDDFRLGSVGKLFEGTEAKVASDGELLVKGKVVFQGYYDNDEATRETLDPEGWLHTGDIGEFDQQGFLYITDRKKDLIVTAGGKNISPANIENALKATQYVSQALVFGDKKPYITALVTLDPDELRTFCEGNGLPTDTYEAIARPEVQELLREAFTKVNAGLGRVEQVKRYRILPIDFTTETGELTPSLKLKRKVVVERYGQWIEEMYAADAADVEAITDPRIGALQDAPKVTA